MGKPGRIVCAYQFAADVPSLPTSTYEAAVLALSEQSACDLTEGWIVIQGYGGEKDCYLFAGGNVGEVGQMLIDAEGSGYAIRPTTPDLAFCLVPDDSVGACCIELEPCMLTTPVACTSLGGAFQGQGTSCVTAGCGYRVMQEPFIYASDVVLECVWDGADTETDEYRFKNAFGNPNNSYQCNDRAFTDLQSAAF